MNRRSFLAKLAALPIVAKVAPKLRAVDMPAPLRIKARGVFESAGPRFVRYRITAKSPGGGSVVFQGSRDLQNWHDLTLPPMVDGQDGWIVNGKPYKAEE